MTAAVGTPKRLPDVERFNRRDFGHLEVQVTIDDPQASTKARSFPLQFEFLADTQMIEDVCDKPERRGACGGKRGRPATPRAQL